MFLTDFQAPRLAYIMDLKWKFGHEVRIKLLLLYSILISFSQKSKTKFAQYILVNASPI